MKKIKLPRKRKKQYIKTIGLISYIGMRYVNEVLKQDNFPLYRKVNGEFKFIKNW